MTQITLKSPVQTPEQAQQQNQLPHYRDMRYRKPNGEEIDIPEHLAVHQHKQLIQKLGYESLGDQNGDMTPPRGTPGRDHEDYKLSDRLNLIPKR